MIVLNTFKKARISNKNCKIVKKNRKKTIKVFLKIKIRLILYLEIFLNLKNIFKFKLSMLLENLSF